MQLISLTANKSSFKPVYFKNETGLNFIIATQKNPESTEEGRNSTFNGVGKSLIVALIHFCLGSSGKDSFKKELSGWVFTLSFKIGDSEFKSERSTDKQSTILLNGDEIQVSVFNKKLGDLLFDIPADTSQLSFRSLIPFFIRPRKASYMSFNNPNAHKNEYQIQITNALLLGLDVLLVEEKFKLRQEQERIRKIVKELNEDEFLKEFFNRKKDASLEAQQVREDIEKLESDLAKFKVAEDYYEVSGQADKLKNDLDDINNKIVLIQNQIRGIEETRRTSPDIKKGNIESIYKEASIILKEEAIKTLGELEKFYEHLSVSREKRLVDQKNALQRQLKELEEEIKQKSEELDDKLQYLNARQALDVFIKLNNKLSDLKAKETNIKKYDELINNYNKSKIQTERKFLESTELLLISLTLGKQ
jgi:uncharacterized protein YydD (DUF2326 family)